MHLKALEFFVNLRFENITIYVFFLKATVYTDLIGNCAAFLANLDEEMDKTVVFQNKSYHLLPWSVSILPDCRNVEFNTAKVIFNTSLKCFFYVEIQMSNVF